MNECLGVADEFDGSMNEWIKKGGLTNEMINQCIE